MDWLRVKPWRGAQVAAGVVVLVVALGVLQTEAWSEAGHLAAVLPALGLVGALAWLAPVGDDGPRAWHAALYVAAWVLAAFALVRLAPLLGLGEVGLLVAYGVVSDPPEPQAEALVAAALALLAWPFARRGAPAMTLLGWVAALQAVRASTVWADAGIGTTRGLLAGFAVVATLAAVARRDRRPEHARAIAGAGGLAVLALALGLQPTVLELRGGAFAIDGPPAGWIALVLLAGFGQVAYGCVDRARGSVVLGGLALVLAALAVKGDVAAWAAVLGAAALAFLLVGLRPSAPPPPPPDAGAPPAAPVPLPPRR